MENEDMSDIFQMIQEEESLLSKFSSITFEDIHGEIEYHFTIYQQTSPKYLYLILDNEFHNLGNSKLLMKFKYPNIEKVYLGPHITYQENDSKEFSFDIETSSSGYPEVKLFLRDSTEKKRAEIEITDASDPDFDETVAKVKIADTPKDQAIKFSIAFVIKTKHPLEKPEKALFSYRIIRTMSKQDYKMSHPILISTDKIAKKPQSVIAVIGHPQAGKGAFINALNDIFHNPENTGDSMTSTKSLRFVNYQNKRDKSGEHFEIAKTQGKFFKMDDYDEELFSLLFKGIKDGVEMDLDNFRKPENADKTKEIGAAIVMCSARWLLKKKQTVNWYFLHTQSVESNNDNFIELLKLINYIKTLLPYTGKVALIITHCDMDITETDKALIMTKLSQNYDKIEGFAQNFIFFGSKTCTWNPRDLNDFDNEFNEKLKQLKGKTLAEMEKQIVEQNIQTHVDIRKCTNTAHKSSVDPKDHPFKTETKKEYLKVLQILGVNLDPEVLQNVI